MLLAAGMTHVWLTLFMINFVDQHQMDFYLVH